jgi:hypothetical protein
LLANNGTFNATDILVTTSIASNYSVEWTVCAEALAGVVIQWCLYLNGSQVTASMYSFKQYQDPVVQGWTFPLFSVPAGATIQLWYTTSNNTSIPSISNRSMRIIPFA